MLSGVGSDARSVSKSDPDPRAINVLYRRSNCASDQGHGWEPIGGQIASHSQMEKMRSIQ
jgi:hypothetical protein